MPLPKFTRAERLLIDSVKCTTQPYQLSLTPWGYIVGGSLLALCGAQVDSVMMLFVAFNLVVVFRILEEWNQRRWTPIFRSIFEKYDSALLEANPSDAAGSMTSTANLEDN